MRGQILAYDMERVGQRTKREGFWNYIHDKGKKKLDLIMLIASKSSIKGTLDEGMGK